MYFVISCLKNSYNGNPPNKIIVKRFTKCRSFNFCIMARLCYDRLIKCTSCCQRGDKKKKKKKEKKEKRNAD